MNLFSEKSFGHGRQKGEEEKALKSISSLSSLPPPSLIWFYDMGVAPTFLPLETDALLISPAAIIFHAADMGERRRPIAEFMGSERRRALVSPGFA